MFKRTLFAALAAMGTLAFAASAQAAYLTLGTANTSNATTTLTGNPASAELVVKNTNGASANAFGLYGLLTATSPTATTAAVRGQNSSTNASGYGMWGSQAGSGTGAYGFAPDGKGVWGNTTSGIGVRGSSLTGTGVLGQHLATTGTSPGISAISNSTDDLATALVATLTPTSGGQSSEAVRAVNNDSSGNGIGVYGKGSGVGVTGSSDAKSGVGVSGDGYEGVEGASLNGTGVGGGSYHGNGVLGSSSLANGVEGASGSSTASGVYGENEHGGYGVAGRANGSGVGVLGDNPGDGGEAGQFNGQVRITRSGASSGTAAALQTENYNSFGEVGWLRMGSVSNTSPVLMLIKWSSSSGDFLQCRNELSPGNFPQKCHIDSNGTFVSGSDFAESLRALGEKASYSPGDVLSMSTRKPGQVLKAHRPFDRALIGVYSTRPAVLGADKGGVTRVGKKDVPVAITGIVPVKATAANGPIHPGDLLTSSMVPGRAMRAGLDPPQGTVLGKSLGFLRRGRGTIKVLVMLR
jgi:hypothetical protein